MPERFRGGCPFGASRWLHEISPGRCRQHFRAYPRATAADPPCGNRGRGISGPRDLRAAAGCRAGPAEPGPAGRAGRARAAVDLFWALTGSGNGPANPARCSSTGPRPCPVASMTNGRRAELVETLMEEDRASPPPRSPPRRSGLPTGAVSAHSCLASVRLSSWAAMKSSAPTGQVYHYLRLLVAGLGRGRTPPRGPVENCPRGAGTLPCRWPAGGAPSISFLEEESRPRRKIVIVAARASGDTSDADRHGGAAPRDRYAASSGRSWCLHPVARPALGDFGAGRRSDWVPDRDRT